MKRKDFLVKTCMACAGAALGGSILGLISACSPIPFVNSTISNKLIEVDLINFKPEQNKLIVKVKGLDFDILLLKKSDGTFTALYMMCTHERQPLGTTNKGLYCSSHGSAFNFDGQVTQQPATKSLTKYLTRIEQQKVIINLNHQI
jgi:nitrite reductase/ring-hydroxylating ferredoxin subunit